MNIIYKFETSKLAHNGSWSNLCSSILCQCFWQHMSADSANDLCEIVGTPSFTCDYDLHDKVTQLWKLTIFNRQTFPYKWPFSIAIYVELPEGTWPTFPNLSQRLSKSTSKKCPDNSGSYIPPTSWELTIKIWDPFYKDPRNIGNSSCGAKAEPLASLICVACKGFHLCIDILRSGDPARDFRSLKHAQTSIQLKYIKII